MKKNNKTAKNRNTNTKNIQRKTRRIKERHEENKGVAPIIEGLQLPRKVIQQIADEVAKRLKRKPSGEKKKPEKKIENSIFLDTSAVIDGRVFDLIKLGVFQGNFVILESVLSELKNIADSKDEIKKERGRKGLKYLDDIKKVRDVKLIVHKDDDTNEKVDDKIVSHAKNFKGRIITCDYNLSKKARISGIQSIDIYELANLLKTNAIPGEIFWIKIIQKGKGEGQGVGYLPDGTMLVAEKGEGFIGKTVKVIVSRVIQTDAGKIFFGKIIEP